MDRHMLFCPSWAEWADLFVSGTASDSPPRCALGKITSLAELEGFEALTDTLGIGEYNPLDWQKL
jgi:hypothetical protein